MLSYYITILFNIFSAIEEEQVFFGKFQIPAAQVFGGNKRAASSSQVEKESEQYQHGVGGCDEKGLYLEAGLQLKSIFNCRL